MRRLCIAAAWTLLALAAAPPDLRHAKVAGAEPKPEASAVARGNTAFAVDLYHQLRKGEGNLIFSPINISASLTMAYAGARGQNAVEMAQVLHLPTGEKQIHRKMGGLLQDFNNRKDVTLVVANALWTQKRYPFFGNALNEVKASYGAEVHKVDFTWARRAARKAINDWAAEKTNGKITDSMPPGVLNSLTRLVLSSAIYFKGEWVTRFDKDGTMDAPFHVSSETDVTVPMMCTSGSKFRWIGTEEFDALEMPYKGRQLSMVVFLPREIDGLANLEKQLTPETLASALGALQPCEMTVYLPRFNIWTGIPLQTPLRAMGMKLAFVNRLGNFPGFTVEPLNIDVMHSAFIEVDEKGTEAGAVTHTISYGCSASAPPVFRADHPFIFLIRDRTSGSILFLGRVVNPKG